MKTQPIVDICEIHITDLKDSDPEREMALHVCRPRVRFASVEETHTFDPVTDEEKHLVWYSPQHFTMFRMQTLWLGDRHDKWTVPLERAYCAFRTDRPPHELARILESCRTVELNEENVGLAEHHISAIATDYLLRREHLMDQVQRLQALHMPDENMRTNMICDTSLLTSRAPRLFASFVAQMALKES